MSESTTISEFMASNESQYKETVLCIASSKFNGFTTLTNETLYDVNSNLDQLLRFLQLAYLLVALFFILILNAVVGTAIVRHLVCQHASYIAILMVLINLVVGSIVNISTAMISLGSNKPITNALWCKIQGTANSATTFWTLMIISIISIDNVIFISYPLKYELIVTRRRLVIPLVLTGLLTIATSVVPIYTLPGMSYSFDKHFLACNLLSRFCLPKFSFNASMATFYAFSSFFVISVTQILIFKEAKSQMKKMRNETNTSERNGKMRVLRETIRALRSIFLFSVIYMALVFMHIILMMQIRLASGESNFLFLGKRLASLSILTVPAIMAPVTQTLRNAQLRQVVRKTLASSPFAPFLRRFTNTVDPATPDFSSSSSRVGLASTHPPSQHHPPKIENFDTIPSSSSNPEQNGPASSALFECVNEEHDHESVFT